MDRIFNGGMEGEHFEISKGVSSLSFDHSKSFPETQSEPSQTSNTSDAKVTIHIQRPVRVGLTFEQSAEFVASLYLGEPIVVCHSVSFHLCTTSLGLVSVSVRRWGRLSVSATLLFVTT